ncbi:MAG: class I SAM-dependent methyltransferase [Opitutales bacterium]
MSLRIHELESSELAELYTQAQRIEGFVSMTSAAYLNAISRKALNGYAEVNSLIEIGCYHGNATILLAWLARRFEATLDVIDIDADNLAFTKNVITQLGLQGSHIQFHLSDFPTWVEAGHERTSPLYMVIDGDHAYDGVRRDIEAVLRMQQPPEWIAFHDFHLRTQRDWIDFAVDRAIFDSLGDDLEVELIGTEFPTTPHFDQWQNYFEPGGREGALVRLPVRRAAVDSDRVATAS